MQQKLDDKVAIITGGSQGIGRATAERFVQEGARVVVADVNVEKGEAFVTELKEQGYQAAFIKVDVTQRTETDAMAAFAHRTFGQVDILVNNAGITKDSTLVKMTEEAFDRVIAVNLKGVFNSTQSTVPYMIEGGYGRVLNAASVVALYGNFGQTNYVATKAGVIGMTKTWARELGRRGITVNAVAPGFIATDMVSTIPDKVLDMFREKTPVLRLGEALDIANAYLFLASEEASFITGVTLSVDGGLTL